jgi:hypothetical protein
MFENAVSNPTSKRMSSNRFDHKPRRGIYSVLALIYPLSSARAQNFELVRPMIIAPIVESDLTPLIGNVRSVANAGKEGTRAKYARNAVAVRLMTDPFETEESKEAYREAMRLPLEANHLLLDFLHQAMCAGEPYEPAATLRNAASALGCAENA